MIDKNFYLENLSAFDILIRDEDPKQAKEVIFRVYSSLQRDMIWLRDVATEEEILEDDVEFLDQIDEELKELDLQYDFQFDHFYQLVQQELEKIQASSKSDAEETDFDADDEEMDDDYLYGAEEDHSSIDSEDELEEITQYILESAKTRFNYSQLLEDFIADEEWIDTEFLLPYIAAKAFDESDVDIAEKMIPNFGEVGIYLELDELTAIMNTKQEELAEEIMAFKAASDAVEQGVSTSEIIRQLAHLLSA